MLLFPDRALVTVFTTTWYLIGQLRIRGCRAPPPTRSLYLSVTPAVLCAHLLHCPTLALDPRFLLFNQPGRCLLRRAPSHQTPLTISEPSLSASYRPSIHRRPWNFSALRSLSARLCLSNPYRSRLPLASFVHHALALHLDLGLDSSSKALFSAPVCRLSGAFNLQERRMELHLAVVRAAGARWSSLWRRRRLHFFSRRVRGILVWSGQGRAILGSTAASRVNECNLSVL
ncbi:hypothetical protein M431DRAFT_211718 [Trichoderma harzianum CBS 226.95]|uniref:Uncharacterized protein n=1 Tax=Trichoderma harzianum CBS 226.95 TaxID=983964 RepID=A0A2T4A4Y2_TRIHA|nr:hypothetical protein M431DRAFT_211718 [Trichoderma harzianum CBS 226.95]PTB52127.1 hypothetical protein M431DRAFT_211718 [Trichoderma harzianum CBS 226.95]